ncbi:MAG: peptide deformylase [Myxococcota bacterium]|jgi:peptide deformylase
MSILKIARLGHPVLRQVAVPVAPSDLGSPALSQLIEDMLETVADADGAGLAAPQVHVSLRVVLLSLDSAPGFTIWINPVLTPLTDEHMITFEGCLSVPGLRGAVARPARLRVQALTPAGAEVDQILDGFDAVVAQHECDHLDGILYVDRLEPDTLMFLQEYRRFGPWPLQDLEE